MMIDPVDQMAQASCDENDNSPWCGHVWQKLSLLIEK
jgi:hypothetical protein